MLLYNVTVKVEKAVASEWVQWMKDRHMPEVMATGMFNDCRLCRILHEEEDGETFAAQYLCDSMEHFQRYQQEFAPALQADHRTRYGNHTVAFRTLMEIL